MCACAGGGRQGALGKASRGRCLGTLGGQRSEAVRSRGERAGRAHVDGKRDAKGEIDRHIQRRRAEREADWKEAEEQHVHLVMQSDRTGRRVGCGSEGGE